MDVQPFHRLLESPEVMAAVDHRLGDEFPMRPDPARAALAFPERVEEAFAFLLERGFRVVARDMTYVRYESDRVGVSVHHGRLSYELGAEIELLEEAASQPSYPIGALAGVTNPKSGSEFYPYATRSPEEIGPAVRRLADQLRAHGDSALDGDRATFDRLADQRRRRGAEMAREIEASRTRHLAGEAWRARDYPRVVELLENLGEDLSEVEGARLDYARRHGG